VRTAAKTAPIPLHYEAGWTESGHTHRCFHKHRAIDEAVACANVHGAGWYVFAVENRKGRQLTQVEEDIVNTLRFGTK
jgi:hypothetical protein